MSGYKYEVGGVRGGAELGGRRLLARLRWCEAGASPGSPEAAAGWRMRLGSSWAPPRTDRLWVSAREVAG